MNTHTQNPAIWTQSAVEESAAKQHRGDTVIFCAESVVGHLRHCWSSCYCQKKASILKNTRRWVWREKKAQRKGEGWKVDGIFKGTQGSGEKLLLKAERNKDDFDWKERLHAAEEAKEQRQRWRGRQQGAGLRGSRCKMNTRLAAAQTGWQRLKRKKGTDRTRKVKQIFKLNGMTVLCNSGVNYNVDISYHISRAFHENTSNRVF